MASKCTICKGIGHDAVHCCLPNSPCDISGCNGRRRVRVSKRPHSMNRRFLRCDAVNCKSFLWLDEEKQTEMAPKLGCYNCDEISHFVSDCPRLIAHCKAANCGVKCKVLTSKQPQSYGRKFVSCPQPDCHYFQWMDDATPTKQRIDDDGESSSTSSSTSRGSVEMKIKLEGKSSVEVKLNFGEVDEVMKGLANVHM